MLSLRVITLSAMKRITSQEELILWQRIAQLASVIVVYKACSNLSMVPPRHALKIVPEDNGLIIKQDAVYPAIRIVHLALVPSQQIVSPVMLHFITWDINVVINLPTRIMQVKNSGNVYRALRIVELVKEVRIIANHAKNFSN